MAPAQALRTALHQCIPEVLVLVPWWAVRWPRGSPSSLPGGLHGHSPLGGPHLQLGQPSKASTDETRPRQEKEVGQVTQQVCGRGRLPTRASASQNSEPQRIPQPCNSQCRLPICWVNGPQRKLRLVQWREVKTLGTKIKEREDYDDVSKK